MSSNWKLFGTGNTGTFENYKTTWGLTNSTVYKYIYDLSGGQVANGTTLNENNWKQYDTTSNPTLSANTGYWVRVDPTQISDIRVGAENAPNQLVYDGNTGILSSGNWIASSFPFASLTLQVTPANANLMQALWNNIGGDADFETNSVSTGYDVEDQFGVNGYTDSPNITYLYSTVLVGKRSAIQFGGNAPFPGENISADKNIIKIKNKTDGNVVWKPSFAVLNAIITSTGYDIKIGAQSFNDSNNNTYSILFTNLNA